MLETANTIFRDVMRKEAADLEYAPSDELKAGRTDCEGYEPVTVDLLEIGEDQTRLETIANHTASQIRELIEGKKYQYKDMMILMPEVSADGQKLADLLKDLRRYARLFEKAEKLVKRYLELADEWNRGELQNRAPVQVEVYTQLRDLGYPKAWAGAPIEAMIHPDLLGADYRELKKGDKVFRTFDGKDILYEGEADGRESVWPIFINEPAYYEKDIAMSLTVKSVEMW